MTIDVVRHRANGMSRAFRESIRGPADEIDANDASAMPHQLSHTCTSRTTPYVLRTTFWGLSSLTAGPFHHTTLISEEP